jgi:hypothetical protein
MYRRELESDPKAMAQHNDNMRANASRRLGLNNEWKRKHGSTNTCKPGTPNRKMEAARQGRINDYQRMLDTARPSENHDGYRKPGAFKKS